jgi:hypothetical protein
MTGGWLSLETWLFMLAGILVLASLEYAHRRGSRVAVTTTPQEFDISRAPAGMLDHLVEGNRAFLDVNSINKGVAKDAVSVSKYMARYTFIMKFVINPRLRLWIAARIAGKLQVFSARLRDMSLRIRKSAEIIEKMCVFIVKGTPVNTNEEIEIFKGFHAMLLFAMNAVEGLRGSMEDAKVSIGGMVGISRDLNLAAGNFERSAEEFSGELAAFVGRLKRVDTLCADKSNTLDGNI